MLDADGGVADAEQIVREVRELPGTIRVRMLYRRAFMPAGAAVIGCIAVYWLIARVAGTSLG